MMLLMMVVMIPYPGHPFLGMTPQGRNRGRSLQFVPRGPQRQLPSQPGRDRGRSPADKDATAVVPYNSLHRLEVWGR